MPPALPARSLTALRILSLAYFVQATGAMAVIAALLPITATWQLSLAQGTFLMTAFGITFALAAPLLQVAIGHVARRRQVLTGLAIFSLAALVLALAPDYPVLVAARIVMGLGAALIGPVLGALAADLVAPQLRGAAIATVLLGLSVAGVAGLPLAAWLATHAGVRVMFAAIGATGLLTALLMRARVPEGASGEGTSLRTMARLLADRGNVAALLVAFFLAAGVYTSLSVIGPALRDAYGADEGMTSIALAVLGIAGILGNLVVTRLATRHDAGRLLAAGIALLLADIALLCVLPRHLAVLFPALVVWAFATDILWPSQQRRVAEVMAAHRGIGLALTASLIFTGMATGAALAGQLYPRLGAGGVLGASALLLGLAWSSLLVRGRCGGGVPSGCTA
ncbi:MFS transporter [Rhodovastum atsumiense]|uniref:MFS transporter n=1 Tax=Rhodovastum atsumiense TaxID=504468 RepID=A0A5M6IKX2_9PROT|nr:MFS transporter [Rhodovastum atsumiense]KAA5608874.1 MFS transporter [Rhodovastum atsumiense]CAH2602331.1 MFS transporter [Rhodovastum atsumiense]